MSMISKKNLENWTTAKSSVLTKRKRRDSDKENKFNYDKFLEICEEIYKK